jgi:hypothetical protein
MQYVAMMVGAWGAWVVLRVIASEREARMRVMQEAMASAAQPGSAPAVAK